MTVRKIKAGRIPTIDSNEYVGELGTIFYSEDTGELRLSDGVTFGGIPVVSNVAANLQSQIDSIRQDINEENLEIDGGNAFTDYTAELLVDGGGA